MRSKLKRKITICSGAMAIALLTGIVLQQPADIPQLHIFTKAVAPQIRPVCDFVPRGEDTTPPADEMASVDHASHDTGTQTPPLSQAVPEASMDVQPPSEPPMPQQAPSPQPNTAVPPLQTPAPPTEPKMGDTRTIYGQKQVYFLGFGWIEDNDEPNECIYAEDMYENGNKVGSIGGGTLVDGDGDINRMVGIMGGQSAEGCSESEQP